MNCGQKKYKILFVAHERKLGGATISLLALIDELRRKGHEIIVIVPTKDCQLAGELKRREIKTISVFFAWWQMPKDWNFLYKLLFKFLYFIENIQIYCVWIKVKSLGINIVHTNSSVTDFGAKLAKKLKVKHVWHVREFGEADYNLQYMFGKLRTWNYIDNNSDKVVFISRSLCDSFKEYLNFNKVKVIYNGISSQYLYEREFINQKEYTTFLVAGNLNRNKQQMLVLRATKKLLEQNIKNFKILIAGESSSMKDSQLYENELKRYIEENQLINVKMLGKVEDMCELRKHADVEIVPSSKEAFGRVTVEAMFSGMPVIGSNSGANIELIEDGKSGLLFENGNAEDLASKMEMFIKEYNKLNIMGQYAFEYVKDKFTAKKNADEIEELYNELIGAK